MNKENIFGNSNLSRLSVNICLLGIFMILLATSSYSFNVVSDSDNLNSYLTLKTISNGIYLDVNFELNDADAGLINITNNISQNYSQNTSQNNSQNYSKSYILNHGEEYDRLLQEYLSDKSIEIKNILNGELYRYFGNIVVPIEIPGAVGEYDIRVVDSKSAVLHRLYLKIDSQDYYSYSYYDISSEYSWNSNYPELSKEVSYSTILNYISAVSDKSKGSDIYVNPIDYYYSNLINGGYDVENYSSNEIFFDKNYYSLGEVVKIYINSADILSEDSNSKLYTKSNSGLIKEFYIVYGESKYVFNGEVFSSVVEFRPENIGSYKVVVGFGNETLSKLFNVVSDSTNPLELNDNSSNSTNTSEVGTLTSDLVSNTSDIAPTLSDKNIVIKKSNGDLAFVIAKSYNTRNTMDSSTNIIDRIRVVSRFLSKKSENAVNSILSKDYDPKEYSIDDFYTMEVSDKIDIDLSSIEELRDSDLSLNNLNIENGKELELRIEPVNTNKIKIDEISEYQKNNIIDSYAMDLSNLNFENGTFTKIAKGHVLWKCAEWNYNTQTCFGTWKKILDITPGESYSIIVSNVDPGYAETGLVTINTNKSMYHPNDIVEIFIAVLDTSGSLVNGANISLNITTPGNNLYQYSTNNETISWVTDGIYKATFANTLEDGNYSLDVMVFGDDSENSTLKTIFMNSEFRVQEYFDYDILRTAPMSVNPFNGPFYVNINIINYANSMFFDFTEKIPKEFIVSDNGGSYVSNDSVYKYLTWNNLVNNSQISYAVQAPLISPELWTIGRATIYDGYSYFTEFRPWYLAADPVLQSRPTNFTDANSIGTNVANAYDNSSTTSATIQLDTAVATRYVVFNTFNISAFASASTLNNLNITYDVETSGTFSNDAWTIQYTNNSGTTWITCSSGTTALTRQNVTCNVPNITNWNITTFSNNFQARIGGGRNGGADGVSMLAYEVYATLNYTPPNVVPSPTSYAKNSTSILQNNTVHFNSTWIDSDGALSHWIFSWNNSGTWVNSTAYAFTSTNFSNITQIANGTGGATIGWRFYANDTQGAWNSTDIDTFTILMPDNTLPSIRTENVTPSSNVSGGRFNITANVTDNQVVQSVWAEIQLPNGSKSNYTMSLSSTNIYSYVYNSTFGGNFSAIIYAYDGTNYNLSATRKYFNVTSNLSTNKTYYGRGESVNISGIGFSPSRNVTITVLDPFGTIVSGYPLNVSTNVNGSFTSLWNISSSLDFKFGNYSITAVDTVISWLNSTRNVTVVAKPTAAYTLTDDPSAPGGSAGTLNQNSISLINNSDNNYTNVVSSTVETYVEVNFTNVLNLGQEVTSAFLFFEHFEISTADVFVKWYNSSSGTYVTLCTINDSATEIFSSCNLSSVIRNSTGANSLSIRLSDNALGANGANWTMIDFAYLTVNFNTSSTMTIVINQPSSTAIPYNFSNVNNNAYDGTTTAIPPATITTGTEASAGEYTALTTSNDVKFDTQAAAAGSLHAYQSFSFIVTDAIADISYLTFTHEGFATGTTSQAADNFNIYVWNITLGSYSLLTTVTGSTIDVTTLFTLYGNGSNYINSTTGEILFFVEGTFSTSGGPNAQADLHTDVAKLDIYKVPVLSGNQNINATAIDADVVSACNYYYVYPSNGSIAGIVYGMSNYSNNIWLNVSNTALYSDGYYNLYVNCTDVPHTSNTNASIYVRIANTGPSVSLMAPANSTNFTYQNINFTWYVTSQTSGISLCNLSIDGTIVQSSVSSTNNQNTTVNQSVNDGLHYWNVTCKDPSNLINVSQTWNFDVDTSGPSITLNYPGSNTSINSSNIQFNYTPIDAHTIMNCSIYIDGLINQTNYTIANGTPNYFTVNSLTQGRHNWSVNCTDSFGWSNRTATRNLTVDLFAPSINISYPPNGENFTGGNATFNFTINDNLDGILLCNLTIDGSISGTNNNIISANNTLVSKIETNIADGQHSWNLTCWDDAFNVNISETRTFGMVGPPRILLNTPINNTWLNYSNISFNYYVYDGNGIFNCSIYLDGVRNQTNTSPPIVNDANNTFNITNIAQGFHNWYIFCYDTPLSPSQSVRYNFTVDTTKPSINLSAPNDSQAFNVTTIEFNYTVIDNLDTLLVCNLSIDGTISTTNRNINSLNNTLINVTELNVTDGVHYWNVTCIDNASNVNTSLTRNFTLDSNPNVILINPANNAKKQNNITFTYYVADQSGINNCSLIFDGLLNQTVTTAQITNNANNTFNLTGISEGLHTWAVLCYDAIDLPTQTLNRNVTVDITRPLVYANTPNSTTLSTTTVEFNFSFTDAVTSIANCTISVDDNLWQNLTTATNNTLKYFNITEISDGVHYWNVSCTDDANNTGYSNTLNFTVDSSPVVTLYSPANNSGNRTGNITFTYYLIESNLTNCSLILNGQINQTENSANITYKNNDGLNNFTLFNMTEGYYNWTVRCVDTSNFNGTTGIYNLYIDKSAPYNITLHSPFENSTIFVPSIIFNWTVYDSISSNLFCNLTINGTINKTINATNGTLTSTTISGFTAGNYNWNVNCSDLGGNIITSETRNFTVSSQVIITLNSPSNNSYDGDGYVEFNYTPQSIADFNDTGTCELYFDGISDQTKVRPLNGAMNTFNISSVAQGTHTWYLNCTDDNGNAGVSGTRTLYVDLFDPSITLNYPLGTQINISYVNFNFTATDNIATYLTCNITVNGTVVASNINATNGTAVNYTISGFADGLHYWNVTCLDFGSRRNTSLTRNFTIAEPPIVRLFSPASFYRTNQVNLTVYYNATDNSGTLFNCSLILNGVINQTNTTVTSGALSNFTILGLVNGNYTWDVNCSDNALNIGTNGTTRTFHIDLIGPQINLSYPSNASTINGNNVTFNWTGYDFNSSVLLNCTLSVSDPLGEGNRTIFGITGYSNSTINYTVSNLSEGTHYWNVSCIDNLNNSGSSPIWVFTINQPDLYLNATRLSFNNTNPDLNETINITANVSNIGGIDANNVLVEFWDGTPGVGLFIGNATRNVPLNGSTIFSFIWNITEGYHNVSVAVDPYNLIEELNETNNNATKNISVLRSIINSPLNNSAFTNPNVTFNFTLQDYTLGNINYTVFVDGVFNGQNNSVIDNVSTLINVTLTQGLHYVQLQARDALGRLKNSSRIYVTIDFTSPVPLINTANGTWFNYSAPRINITATDNVYTNISYRIYVNDSVNVTGTILNATSIIAVLTSMNDGLYSIIMEAFDYLNNTANSTTRFIYVDTNNPTITLNSPAEGTNFTNRSVILNYTANDNLAINLNCSIFIDGINVINQTINNGVASNYTATGLSEGTHYWNVTCVDQALNRNNSITQSFNVYIGPSITLVSPLNAVWSRNSTNIFSYNVSDETGLENCSLILNGAIVQTNITSEILNSGTNNFTVTSITSGNYTWAVQCFDNTSYHAYNISLNRTLYVDLVNPVPNITTANSTWFNTATPTITINITDNMDTALDYTIYVNNTANTVGTVTNSTLNPIVLSALQNGTYNITLEARDEAGNMVNSTSILIYIDTLRPNITLTNPVNDTNLTIDYVDLNFTVTDNMAQLLYCNVTLDGNTVANNIQLNNPQSYNLSLSNIGGGYHNWNVTCIDQASNVNTSLTFRFYIVIPDVYVDANEIYFSNNNPIENETLNVTATIRNIGLASTTNFTVQIRLNSIAGTLLYNDTMILGINGSQNITANYTLPLGNTTFYVLADIPITSNGTILETNESNNNASKSVYVSLWQYVFGLTTDKIAMIDQINYTIYEWISSNSSGNKLFVADIDSNINWKSLKAIGINSTNQTSFIDFNTLDLRLSSENFTDSVNRTFTISGSPIETANYTIFTRQVINVSIVNSINNSNFKTGILWDSGDGGIRFNGTQDVLFVSPINKTTNGYNGTVDYEIRIPASLRSYKQGQNMVVFYAEIN